jgi:hypothetical protein
MNLDVTVVLPNGTERAAHGYERFVSNKSYIAFDIFLGATAGGAEPIAMFGKTWCCGCVVRLP